MAIGSYAVASDTGRRRRRNEDNYVVAPPLFAVADGMGGAQAGEVASKLAASRSGSRSITSPVRMSTSTVPYTWPLASAKSSHYLALIFKIAMFPLVATSRTRPERASWC